MTVSDQLAALNATLNTTSALLLLAGFFAIRRRRVVRHRRLMLAAFASSVLFLAGYLTRVTLFGTHRFPELGALRAIYLGVLMSHTVLAVVAVPLVLRTLYLGWRRLDDKHRRIARFTWPAWLYVSVTGVVVYVMLYQVAPS